MLRRCSCESSPHLRRKSGLEENPSTDARSFFRSPSSRASTCFSSTVTSPYSFPLSYLSLSLPLVYVYISFLDGLERRIARARELTRFLPPPAWFSASARFSQLREGFSTTQSILSLIYSSFRYQSRTVRLLFSSSFRARASKLVPYLSMYLRLLLTVFLLTLLLQSSSSLSPVTISSLPQQHPRHAAVSRCTSSPPASTLQPRLEERSSEIELSLTSDLGHPSIVSNRRSNHTRRRSRSRVTSRLGKRQSRLEEGRLNRRALDPKDTRTPLV